MTTPTQPTPPDDALVEQCAEAVARLQHAKWPQDANRYRRIVRAAIPIIQADMIERCAVVADERRLPNWTTAITAAIDGQAESIAQAIRNLKP